MTRSSIRFSGVDNLREAKARLPSHLSNVNGDEMREMLNLTPHQQAIDTIQRLVSDNMGGSLDATADCNQCSEVLSI